MNNPVDVVIPWVDGNDPYWREVKDEYLIEGKFPDVATSSYRFRSWDNLQFIFRGIEKYMPWVRNVYLITCGHFPDFISNNCKRLITVKHEDYIPAKYLPTFSTNTIVLNLHRLPELSENYILFNDDIFPIREVDEEYYFFNDQVCDQAIQTIIVPGKDSVSLWQCREANNIRLINCHFDKRRVIADNRDKWFHPDYRKEDLDRNTNLEYWNQFTGFRHHHMAQAYKKSILNKIWELEPKALDIACSSRFRYYTDLTEYVVRYWQLCEGCFIPRRSLGTMFNIYKDGYEIICDYIKNQRDIMLSIEDTYISDYEFEEAKKIINEAFEEILPNKSGFEI